MTETTDNCRYCLMCRHICPVTRVTFNEATSPHGWALLVASVRRGLLEWDATTADVLYQCADCGLCRAHCATDQPLPEALAAARAEVATAGKAPTTVAAVAAALERWGNPYNEVAPQPDSARSETTLFVGAAAWHRERPSLEAARRLLSEIGIEHRLAGVGRSSGYLAYTLGLTDLAQQLARQTVGEIEQSDCRTIITLSAEHAYVLTTLYPRLGAPLPEGITIVELSALLAAAHADGKLRLQQQTAPLAYLDPDHSARREGRWQAPRQLLAAIAPRVENGFWRERRAYGSGASGGLPWTQPELAGRLARAALADVGGGNAMVITDAPETLAHLRAHQGQTAIRGLYELLVECLVNDER